jgi:hypothetical protein
MADGASTSGGLLRIGLIALAVYIAYRVWKAHLDTSNGATTTTGTKTTAPADAVDVAYDCGADLPIFTQDVVFDQQPVLYRQVIRPAGRCRPYADVPPKYYALAFRLLALDLVRDDASSRRFALYQQYVEDMKTGRAIDSAIGAVVSAILSIVGAGYLGALYAAVVAQQVKDMSAAISSAESTEAAFENLRLAVKDKDKLPPAQLAFLETPSTGDYPQAALGPVSSVPIEAIWRSQYEDGTGVHLLPTTPWKGDDGTSYTFNGRWFTLTPIGFLMPWNSLELQGPTLHDTCNILARVYRALDTIRVMMFPIEPGGKYINANPEKPTLYWYHNTVLGDLKGTYLPPTKEDRPYVDAAGQTWSSAGVAELSVTQKVSELGAQGGVSYAPTAKNQVLDMPGVVPDPNTPQTYTPEFSPHDPPPANVALTNPPPPPQQTVGIVVAAPPPPPPSSSPSRFGAGLHL